MRLLFAHDHRFRIGSAGGLYTLGSFPVPVWDRYLKHFDEVHVVARDGGPIGEGANLARADRPGVTFEFLPSLASLRQLIVPSAEATARMKRAVASADAVVARLPSEIGLLAMRHAQHLGKPYAVEVVGCAWDGSLHHGSPLARLYAPLIFHRMRQAVKNAPLVLYVTSDWLQGRYPTKGFTACASNVEIVPLTEAEHRCREKRLEEIAAGRAPRLGTVAALTVKTKGIQTALAALARLRLKGMELSYSVLGPGPIEPWKALARRHGVADVVSFDGTRESAEGVRRWLDNIDIHLQPSFQEGLPRATIEAMSRAVGCIGSTCGGIPELISRNRTHAPGDSGGLADLIERLASDPKELMHVAWRDLDVSRTYLPQILNARRAAFYSRLREVAASRAVAA